MHITYGNTRLDYSHSVTVNGLNLFENRCFCFFPNFLTIEKFFK